MKVEKTKKENLSLGEVTWKDREKTKKKLKKKREEIERRERKGVTVR